MKELDKLRKQIDRIDEEILDALNRRSKVVLEIGHIKRNANARFYSPSREQKIIKRLKGLNKGPFPNDALRTIFREIMSASLSLEEPLKVAGLGPAGTYTHLAALKHFGSSSAFVPQRNPRGVFEAVESGKVEFGIVAIENSNEGVVSLTLDLFVEYDLNINSEVMLEVSHNLLSRSGDAKKVKKIYAHPQAAAQCRGWLEANMPDVPVYECDSNAKAAELASEKAEVAAIAGELAAKMYDLHFVERHIEDNRSNYTRFLVIGGGMPGRTGNDKTSVMFSAKDKPGSLYDILYPCKKAKINLTKIESRPSKRKAWEYIFFVDMQGHIEERKISATIEEMKKQCLFLKVLGSYPCGD